MKTSHEPYLSHRVLKINVGFLLSDGPGNSHDSRLEIPSPVRVADDLIINYINGPLRLTRAKEGILVQGLVHIGLNRECSRCLETFEEDLEVELEELYTSPPTSATEFGVGADAQLDLAPLLRAEIILETGQKPLCRPDCKGICPTCGANRNTEVCNCADEDVDPRLAILKKLLDSSE